MATGAALISFARYAFGINNGASLIRQIGEAEARGVVFSQSEPYPCRGTRKIVLEYQDELKKGGPSLKPSFTGLKGFMTSKLLVSAIRRAGPGPSREKVFAALEALGRFDLGDYVVNDSPVQHRVEPSVDVTIIGSKGKLYK